MTTETYAREGHFSFPKNAFLTDPLRVLEVGYALKFLGMSLALRDHSPEVSHFSIQTSPKAS